MNNVETRLTEIWTSVLEQNELSQTDNFFEKGGNSIRIIQLHTHIELSFPGVLKIADIFSYPTIGEQAEVIRERSNVGQTNASQSLHFDN